jgi:hypothetical protein
MRSGAGNPTVVLVLDAAGENLQDERREMNGEGTDRAAFHFRDDETALIEKTIEARMRIDVLRRRWDEAAMRTGFLAAYEHPLGVS